MEPAILVGVFSHPERHDFWGQFGLGAASSIPSGPPYRGLLSLSVPALPACRFSQRSSSSLGSSGCAEGTGIQCLHTSSHGDATAWPTAPQDQQGPHTAFWGSATTPGHQTLALKEGPKCLPLFPSVPSAGPLSRPKAKRLKGHLY